MRYECTFSCGHSGSVEIDSDDDKTIKKKLSWLRRKGKCPECFKADKRAERESRPLSLGLTVNPSNDKNIYVAYVRGFTTPHKESLKSLGFKWTLLGNTCFNSDKEMFGDSAWSFCSDNIEDIRAIISRTKNIFPSIMVFDFSNATEVKLAIQRNAEYKKQTAKRSELLDKLPRTQAPSILPKDANWNHKIYGNTHNGYYIYLNSVKQPISFEDKIELQSYMSTIEQNFADATKIIMEDNENEST